MLVTSLRLNKMLNSVLKAAEAYKNSATQRKMHEFVQNDDQIKNAKQKIDYETVEKESKGYLMIRQFLFQQKHTDYQVNFPDKYLVPTGKWTIQELQRQMQQEQKIQATPSQRQNFMIFKNLQKDLQEKLSKYYNNVGKKDYTFSVKEQVKKIELMTNQQFEQFLKNLKA